MDSRRCSCSKKKPGAPCVANRHCIRQTDCAERDPARKLVGLAKGIDARHARLSGLQSPATDGLAAIIRARSPMLIRQKLGTRSYQAQIL
jgi:hypothetical protein